MRIRSFLLLLLFLALFSENSLGQLTSELPQKVNIALVLSGGGSRGFAHIGVLEVLDSAHIPIDLIVGTSMGAIIGGLYSAGYSPKELERLAIETNWADILSLDDDSRRGERQPEKKDERSSLLALRFNGFFQPVLPQALSSGQRLTMLLNSLILSSTYGTHENFLRDLKVPFIGLATDIVTGKRKLITHGDLTSAIRASATLPLRFYPLVQDSSLLVDGGLLGNVPIDIARDSANASIVIASNTTAELRSRDQLNSPWDVADQVITLMMRHENIQQLKRADIIITPQLEHSLADNFSNAEMYIEQGRIAARNAIAAIKTLLERNASTINVNATQDSIYLSAIREIRIHGLPADVSDALLPIFSSLRGNSLSRESLETDIRHPLLEQLRRKGYALAHVDSVVISKKPSVIDLYLDPGYIREIKINGLHSIFPVVVLDQLPFTKGDIFRSEQAERGLRNLTATGYFSYSNLEFVHDPTATTVIVIREDSLPMSSTFNTQTIRGSTSLLFTFEERATQVLRLGGLADNEYGAQFSMEYANENLFGLGGEFSLKGGLGRLSGYGGVSLSGGPPLFGLAFSLYTGYKDITSYTFLEDIPNAKFTSISEDVVREFRDLGGSIRANLNIGRDASLVGQYRLERQRYFTINSGDSTASKQVVSALRGEVTVDSRDDPDYPHSGHYFIGYYEVGTRIFGGDIGFTKISAAFQEAIPLSRLHNVQLSASIGVADRTLPREEQFALGGIETFFGLNEYELRGKQYALGSIGYQVAIPNTLLFPTFVLFRYDLGAMWSEPTAIKFESFIHGVGAQIGFKTPIGLARFGLGENFRFGQNQKKPLLLNEPRFYFSIGANL